jgi:hypothetical protein
MLTNFFKYNKINFTKLTNYNYQGLDLIAPRILKYAL